MTEHCENITTLNSTSTYKVKNVASLFWPFAAIPVSFSTPLENVTVTENEAAVFSCKISKPVKKIQWAKDGTVLKHGKKFDMKSKEQEHTLKIPKCAVDDAGLFSVEADGVKSQAQLKVNGESSEHFISLEERLHDIAPL